MSGGELAERARLEGLNQDFKALKDDPRAWQEELMDVEDEVDRTIARLLREKEARHQAELQEKEAKHQAELQEKDAVLQEKDAALQEKDAVIREQERRIAELMKQLTGKNE